MAGQCKQAYTHRENANTQYCLHRVVLYTPCCKPRRGKTRWSTVHRPSIPATFFRAAIRMLHCVLGNCGCEKSMESIGQDEPRWWPCSLVLLLVVRGMSFAIRVEANCGVETFRIMWEGNRTIGVMLYFAMPLCCCNGVECRNLVSHFSKCQFIAIYREDTKRNKEQRFHKLLLQTIRSAENTQKNKIFENISKLEAPIFSSIMFASSCYYIDQKYANGKREIDHNK